ncbi:GNAT family N-acetyltransferase [Streptomyces sp. NPDC093108]|uniref:GNAT family N-acetyltransferase n=1 Tax=Streptomyces sp. NPDC093108 TaxID=3366030 RepID=UPI00380AC4B5
MNPDHEALLALFDREMREHARPDGPGVRIERTGEVVRQVGADDMELMARAHERAFGSDWSRLRHQVLARLAEDPDGFVGVLAMVGEEPVSSARMELYPGTGFAGLWGGGTVEAWRGKGIYRALVAFRARIAAERGCRYLQVDASEMSSPILRRLGFAALSTTTPYVYRSH